MIFKILNRWGDYPPSTRNQVILTWDNWNDFQFYTSFGIFYIDEDSKKHELSGIKIGFIGQSVKQRVYSIGHSFDRLESPYFSLGTSEEYYEKLNLLPDDIRDEILSGLRDLAKDTELFYEVINEPVVAKSLLRDLSISTVTGQFKRMTEGGAKLTDYHFKFNYAGFATTHPVELTFDVSPESQPPTNIHVIIGRNGVGKTYLINSMIDALVIDGKKQTGGGDFDFVGYNSESGDSFANLISISFSAFDEVEPKSKSTKFMGNISYSYIGLKNTEATNLRRSSIKDPSLLADEFLNSLRACRSRLLSKRWLQAVSTLESDPNFFEAGIRSLIDEVSPRRSADVLNVFRRLSSGHKIVLYSITSLIEKLQERSLVIMDEPEAHLHPPLLSAFIRSVSDLLIMTNGVAIVATHSPVILQEVPRSCVWKLRRSGPVMVGERLARESFGENVGTLTNEIFGLEVTDSGFYKMLNKIMKLQNFDYESVIREFGGQLGMEARSILMAEIANRE
ncbi:hypothetical protein GCM10010967_57630 [Dyadobacter beijingensis]|uniref:AAA+ ATPase domain-containing protein n=1 Tax=Dyadobacter beijingensis TaxID=365489 RepID=A0ABQ2ING1_9BACT|nr:AAA family ATPase [Dyadobacter beijingensis]GGN13903.1 hypothetical protein GCM10010967_57630 [Dyadobacter beijingensis]